MSKHIETITIYSWNAPAKYPTDIRSEAFDEIGNLITWHVSSSMKYVPHDMGLSSDWKHQFYNRYFPQGYRLNWIKHEPPARIRHIKGAK